MASARDSEFPTDLAGFGYEFKNGKMRNIKTGGPFEFVVREGDQAYNQMHYEALGEVITEEVYKLLESDCNLRRFLVPSDASRNDPSTFIFLSDGALDNPDRLLVLIHGSGVVRAGQWARRLIINDSLDWGTQIPFIKKAQEIGYGILVMNTNDNKRKVAGSQKMKIIKGSGSPEEHACYVWKKFVHKAKARHIALIAHSYGGCVTTNLFRSEKKDFLKRVFAVAMTDSVHYYPNPDAFKALVKVSRNWVSSSLPLDTQLENRHGDIARVSAGVHVHEKTSYSSIESVFKFLEERYNAVTKRAGKEKEEESCSQEEHLDRKMSIGSDCGTVDDACKSKVSAPGVHQMSDSETEGDQVEKNGNDEKGGVKENTLERAMTIEKQEALGGGGAAGEKEEAAGGSGDGAGTTVSEGTLERGMSVSED
ncbi:cotranscriptional regulator ARB2A [Palaemon carinicauda]|uniref:cotranscriptional regulator ARB2A n=1 Tax=Palaemon carinicauda TaxID=392227 RepID=UPI0035B644E0